MNTRLEVTIDMPNDLEKHCHATPNDAFNVPFPSRHDTKLRSLNWLWTASAIATFHSYYLEHKSAE